MHVGFNLIFLVPGETGGMEVAAREQIRAIAELAPGLALTAFVNREAAAHVAEGGELLPPGVAVWPLPIRARARWQWALGEQMLLPIAAGRPRLDRSRPLALRAADHDPRPDLRALSRSACGHAGGRHARARAAGRAALRARDRGLPEHQTRHRGADRHRLRAHRCRSARHRLGAAPGADARAGAAEAL